MLACQLALQWGSIMRERWFSENESLNVMSYWYYFPQWQLFFEPGWNSIPNRIFKPTTNHCRWIIPSKHPTDPTTLHKPLLSLLASAATTSAAVPVTAILAKNHAVIIAATVKKQKIRPQKVTKHHKMTPLLPILQQMDDDWGIPVCPDRRQIECGATFNFDINSSPSA